MGLDLAGFFDDFADEDFGVAVYRCYYGWGHGLGEGCVCDLLFALVTCVERHEWI